MTSQTERLPITAAQLVRLAIMGAIFWFVAALVVRWTATTWAGCDGATALVFVLVVASTPPLLWLGMKVAALGRDGVQIAAAVMVGTASLLDGLALTWFPTLYGTEPATVLAGAAAILWGAGVALALGIVLERLPLRT